MKLMSVCTLAGVCAVAGSIQAAIVVDPLNRDMTAPAERTTVIGLYGNYDATWSNDPLLSIGGDPSPYIFTGTGDTGYGYIQYVAAEGFYINSLSASIAYIGSANAIEIRDADYKVLASSTTTAVTDDKNVSWYTVTFNAEDAFAGANISSVYLVIYFGDWGAGYSSVGTVQLDTQPIPEAATVSILALGGLLMLTRRK